MDGYGPDSYGEGMADVYDEWYRGVSDVEGAVARLREWAGGGSVLELGVGTGRLAVPLAATGLAVWGVDASPAMVERLRARPGGEDVHAVLGDMAELDVEPPEPFRLAFVAYNTFFNLTTEAAQRRCLARVRDLLAPGGRLAVEAFVPSEEGQQDQDVRVRSLAADRVVLAVSRRDPATRTAAGQYVDITEQGIKLRPWRIRYLWPEQLDALAGEAGLALEGRWGGWRDEPFDHHAERHVSLYRRA